MTKQRAFRKGDRVRVINPMRVHRIGYPMDLTETAEELLQDPGFLAGASQLANHCYPIPSIGRDLAPKLMLAPSLNPGAKVTRDMAFAFAKYKCQAMGWGGNQRKIYEVPFVPKSGYQSMPANEYFVEDTRKVAEGERVEGWSYTDYEGSYESQGPSFATTDNVVLLGIGWIDPDDNTPAHDFLSQIKPTVVKLEIRAKYVELVEAAPIPF